MSRRYKDISGSERVICVFLFIGLLAIIFLLLINPLLFVIKGRVRKGKISERAISYRLPSQSQLIVEWQSYPARRIYEKIDGRATLFEEYGIERLDFASVKLGREEFDVYVYVMKSSEGALGAYLAEQPGRSESISVAGVGEIADRTETLVRVCRGNIYFTIIALGRQPDIRKGIKIAKTLCVSLRIKKKQAGLDILSVLPVKGMLRSSLSLNKEETFGLQSLSGTISADYAIDGIRFTFFVKRLDDDTNGVIVMRKIYDELKEFDVEGLRRTKNSLSCKLFDKHLFVVLKKNRIFGVYGKLSEKQAHRILAEFVR